MTETKRYYWLKLKKDFFKRHDIKIIESMPNGKDYLLFYLKLLVESVDHDGNLRFNDTIPYDEKMLSVVTNTNIDIVRSAMKLFTELNMIEILEDSTIFMKEVEKMMGAETYWAEQKRIQRNKKEVQQIGKCPEIVQSMSNLSNQEIEKEIDIDIEIINNMSEHEREILKFLKSVKKYRFNYEKDLAFIRTLSVDFPNTNILEKIKEWNTWLLDHPLTEKSNPRSQIRNWIKPKDWQKKGGFQYGANKQPFRPVQTTPASEQRPSRSRKTSEEYD